MDVLRSQHGAGLVSSFMMMDPTGTPPVSKEARMNNVVRNNT
jgi:hypothetical protein